MTIYILIKYMCLFVCVLFQIYVENVMIKKQTIHQMELFNLVRCRWLYPGTTGAAIIQLSDRV